MIKLFDPVIYPFKIWITKDATLDEIDRQFVAISDDGEEGLPFKKHHVLPDGITADARTYVVGNKKSGYQGCLVYLTKKTALKILSHEACHCADWLFEQIGDDEEHTFRNGEPYAYYQSWVFECLYKTLKNR